jgi:hypothetical protein
MSRMPSRFSFGRAALLTTALIGAGATGMFGTAHAQNAGVQQASTTTSAVPSTECAVFAKYFNDEFRDFKKDFSRTFLVSMSRFVRADCQPVDKDGEIQIITENNRDGASLGTALSRMGKTDILGLSGVKHCHRPEGGSCTPTTTGAATPRAVIGGG